ncbi:hypothetical protein V5O48_006013 [Marasmius crinis-equi]|uniref:Uncharacterized protein n=1 Tax=Marasmius crinis-equi TaxID=585013 RepID=A0ABR3FKQ1_9AGAR
MPDYLQNAQDFSIGDNSNFSTTHGDQHNNNYHITAGKVSQRKHYIVGTEEEEARYAEYHDVKYGDIVIGRDLGCSVDEKYDEKRRQRVLQCERRSFTAEVRNKVGKVSSSYTIVQYRGPEKEEAWKRDFDQFSGAFVGGLGHMYLEILRLQLGCADSELWLDSSRGVLCRGPEGPYRLIPIDYGSSYNESAFPSVPSDGKMLREDILVQYLATLQLSRDLDCAFVRGLAGLFESSHTIDMRVDRPTVISSLTSITIAMADAGITSIWASGSSCLGEREMLSSGLTRFTVKHHGHHLKLDWIRFEAWDAWIAQSPMAFHAQGVPLEGDLNLIVPYTSNGALSRSRTKQQRRQECETIYLFACPSRASPFWSFEEDGHLPILDDLCKYLGLPIKLEFKCRKRSFPTQIYWAMQDYQILRGFDPTTADFAQHCGFYDFVFDPVQSSLAVAATLSQFEDLDDSDFGVIKHDTADDKYCDGSIPLLFDEVPPKSMEMPERQPAPAPSSNTFSSRLPSPFS